MAFIIYNCPTFNLCSQWTASALGVTVHWWHQVWQSFIYFTASFLLSFIFEVTHSFAPSVLPFPSGREALKGSLAFSSATYITSTHTCTSSRRITSSLSLQAYSTGYYGFKLEESPPPQAMKSILQGGRWLHHKALKHMIGLDPWPHTH